MSVDVIILFLGPAFEAFPRFSRLLLTTVPISPTDSKAALPFATETSAALMFLIIFFSDFLCREKQGPKMGPFAHVRMAIRIRTQNSARFAFLCYLRLLFFF